MDTPSINTFYRLEDIEIAYDKLFLDPYNPRIITLDADEEIYRAGKLTDKNIQDDIKRRIDIEENNIDQLVNSILNKGWLAGSQPILAKEIDSSQNYLVLEGNRRVSAINKILTTQRAFVDLNTRASIEKLKIQKFKYIENEFYTEEDVIEVLLGNIHISGILSWGAMEKAHYIYKSYMREFKRYYPRDGFSIYMNAIVKVCQSFNMKTNDVKKTLKIYRVFEQLNKVSDNVDKKKYSLIELSVNDAKLAKSYFELDDTYLLSELGIERILALLFDSNSVIKNPAQFKKFSYIYKNGNDYDVSAFSIHGKSVDTVYDEVKSRLSGSQLAGKLEKLLWELESIPIKDVQGGDYEQRLIQKIVAVVNKRLAVLANISNS